MKRNVFLSAVALTSLVTVSACGGGADAPAAEETEEAAATETEATEEEEAVEIVEVEANGTVIEVQMYTKDPDDASGLQVFKPRLVKAKVGDTIKFVPTDPTHQSSSIDGGVPAGAAGWKGEVNKEVSAVMSVPGVYLYQCVPHYAAGMVGMIVVEGEGSDANVEAAKGITHPGLAGKAFEAIFAEAGL